MSKPTSKRGKGASQRDAGRVLREMNEVLLLSSIRQHELTEQAQQAELASAKLAAIVESSDDAIISTDLDGVIRSWNRGAQRLFGYSAEEAIGKPVTFLIPQEHVDEEPDILARIRRGEAVEHFETVRRRKDGSLLDISLTISPIKNAAGEVGGASKVARDITRQKRTEAALKEARMEADAANRAKDLFLGNLSHELRTPLHAIVGWLSILRREGRTEKELAHGLDVIERNTQAQVQLIEDLLEVSRIVSGKLRLNIERCDLSEVIGAAIEAVRAAADAKGIVIELELDPDAREGSCDPARIQQVICNLLSNAIKFTPQGGKVIVALDRQHSMTRIIVSDNGQGMSEDFLPYIFDRFRQEDSTTRRKFGGLGLGLSIAKQLMEMHGGTVEARSEGEGRGATFTVKLPIKAVAAWAPGESPRDVEEVVANEATPVASGKHAVRLGGLQIVVVDDEPDARRIVSRLLADAGAIVTAAANVPEALSAIESVRPHVLVSDLAMPGQDGYDLIRQIRAKGLAGQDLPAVALTAIAHKDCERSALLAGFQVHLAKPVEPHDLITVVASLAGRTGAASSPAREEP